MQECDNKHVGTTLYLLRAYRPIKGKKRYVHTYVHTYKVGTYISYIGGQSVIISRVAASLPRAGGCGSVWLYIVPCAVSPHRNTRELEATPNIIHRSFIGDQ
jgi:hypothetical protein